MKKLYFNLSLFLALLALGFLLSPGRSQAAPGDQNWDVKFGLPSCTNVLVGVTAQNGEVYVGGQTSEGSFSAPFNCWDGNQWSTIGVFTNAAGPTLIYSAAFVGNTLYVGGLFGSVNGVAANGLAAWNGTSWSGVGFNGYALTLASSGNNLYVGGIFTGPDGFGMTMTNVGYWDGSAWHAMGYGLASEVLKILPAGGLVYASGALSSSGSQAIANLAVWNGSGWQNVGGGANGTINGLAYTGGNLFAGGSFTQAGTTSAKNIAEWNGTTWSALSTGVNGTIYSVDVLSNQVCVAGAFTQAGGITCSNFAIWNGASWVAAGTGISATASRSFSTGTNVYVVGNFAAAGGVYVNGLGSWNGNQWNAVGTPGRLDGISTSVFAVANDASSNLYAGGLFSYAGLTNASYISRFDGTKWNPLGTGIGPYGGTTIVRAIGVSSNNIYAGGLFSTAGGVGVADMARWDGTNWYALGGGPGGVVASILVRTDGVYAAGAPLYGSGPSYSGSPFFARWDGTNWNNCLNVSNTLFPVLISTPNIAITAMASIGTNIFVGGQLFLTYYSPGFENETSCYDIFQYNGTWAQPVGTGVNSNILAMAVIGTNLYAGGYFTIAGGYAANQIAMWNGINWTNLGSGVVGNGTVLSLAAIGTNLFAGGSFTNMGGVTANGVAEWNGINWTNLGSGVGWPGLGGAEVAAFDPIGSDLYVGGVFQNAGGKPSFNLAHWNGQVNFNTPQLVNPKWLGSGQFQTTLWGVGGVTNIIQASTNFVTWTPVFTNSMGIYNYADPASPAYHLRLYRAASGP
jgi:trimeric autotransporter adhesin